MIPTVSRGVDRGGGEGGAPPRGKLYHTLEKNGKIKEKGEKSGIKGENSMDKKIKIRIKQRKSD